MIYDCYFDEEDFYRNNPIMLDFAEGLAAVNIDGKCGFINKSGELVIPAIYDGNFWRGEWWNYIPKFYDGIVRVRKDGKAGCIDKTGKVVIPFEYYWLGNGWTGYFNEGLACIDKYNEEGERIVGLIDKTGNFVVPLGHYDGVSDFNGTLAFVMKYDMSGDYGAYIDRTGRLVTGFEYEVDIWSNHYYYASYEGLTITRKDGWLGVLDEKGNTAVPFIYKTLMPFSDGLAYASEPKDGGWSGFIDKRGNLIISYEHYDDMARSFSEGLVWVMKNGRYGYADRTGREAVSCIYDSAGDFSEGLAAVQKDGKWAILENLNYSDYTAPKTGGFPLVLLWIAIYLILILFYKKTGRNIWL
jgi:hypothetical protein